MGMGEAISNGGFAVAFLGPKGSYCHQVCVSFSFSYMLGSSIRYEWDCLDVRVIFVGGIAGSFLASGSIFVFSSSMSICCTLLGLTHHLQAALQTYPASAGHTLVPQPTIKGVFEAVQNKNVQRGVVPFENSTNGSVIQTLDLFADVNNENPSIRVCGEALVPVQHCLLGRRQTTTANNGDSLKRKASSEPEDQDFSHIQKLYSHPQAWTQCTPFLAKHLSHAKREDTTSTSQAADLVSKDATGESAAICSKLSAELYNLDILTEGIEEKEGNTTKFLLLRQAPEPPTTLSESSSVLGAPNPYSSETRIPNSDVEVGGSPKSLLTFTVPHSDPGALGRALGVFGTYGINLTSMHTRPSGERAWHYLFFIELEGVRGDSRVEAALDELSTMVDKLRICGSWRGF